VSVPLSSYYSKIYITKSPLFQANKDLNKISYLLKQTDRESFEYYIELYGKYDETFLKERTLGKD
jgi:hypothetical protein